MWFYSLPTSKNEFSSIFSFLALRFRVVKLQQNYIWNISFLRRWKASVKNKRLKKKKKKEKGGEARIQRPKNLQPVNFWILVDFDPINPEYKT